MSPNRPKSETRIACTGFVAGAMFLASTLLTIPVYSQVSVSPDTARHAVVDTTKSIDTLRVRFIPAIGSMRQAIDSSDRFHSSRFLWTDARNFGNLAWEIPGFFYRDLGEPAKPGQLNAWGTDWRGLQILMDGRPMNDPITGTYNLNDMPMEFVEQLEVFDGTGGYGQAWNASGAALNVVTRQYNSLRPITKIRFVQAPYNSILTDGLFTQNLLRGLNFMFGFQRQVSDGRYNGVSRNNSLSTPAGAVVDNWNVRTRLRYNVSDRLNFALTDFYTKDVNGLNGGIDLAPTTDITNNVVAYVNSPNALETVARRDVALTGIGMLTDDSTMVTQMNAYYTHDERQFTNPGTVTAPLNISDVHYAELRGLRLQQSFRSSFHATSVGVMAEHSQYSSNGFLDSAQINNAPNRSDRSIYSAFLNTALHPVDIVTLEASGRFDTYGNESGPSFGAKVSFLPVSFLSLFGEYGHSLRFPTYQESSWVDSTILRPTEIKKEQHTLLRGGFQLLFADNITLAVTGFDRTVDDAILFQPATTRDGSRAVRILNVKQVHTRGVAGSLRLQYGPLEFAGTALYQDYVESDTTKELTPNLILTGELSYRNKFFDNALDAKFGVRTQFMNRQRGMTFNPRLMLYEENTETNIGLWTRLDAFAILRIGDAYITLSYENLLNASYIITPIYPMPERTFRLGVNWVFID